MADTLLEAIKAYLQEQAMYPEARGTETSRALKAAITRAEVAKHDPQPEPPTLEWAMQLRKDYNRAGYGSLCAFLDRFIARAEAEAESRALDTTLKTEETEGGEV